MLALLLLLLVTPADGPRWHSVPVAKIAATRWTHVCTTGTVTLKRREADGDAHIRITDGAAFIVAEVIPELPFPLPAVGDRVRVCGITRYDRGHGWGEIHPVTKPFVVLVKRSR